MSYDATARRDTPLARLIKQHIDRDGPLSVLEYVRLCLEHPEHGYYRTKPVLGARGDFITAPEISQIFGELIGLWSAVVWRAMGRPPLLNLVELGPGRGTLMADALRALRVMPDCLAALRGHLVESNAVLMQAQRDTLHQAPCPVTWHASPAELPQGPTILLANEFLDTCPAAELEVVDEGLAMRGVGLDAAGELTFVRLSPVIKANAADLGIDPAPAPGTIIEQQSFAVLLDLLSGAGAAPFAGLFIDYGYETPSTGASLQAVRNHSPEHPLTSPGEADLTVQVNFAAFRRLAEAAGLACDGPIPQAEFLGALGIMERASRLMAANPAKALAIETAVARLMAPAGMGSRFKVIGVRTPALATLPGFALRGDFVRS